MDCDACANSATYGLAQSLDPYFRGLAKTMVRDNPWIARAIRGSCVSKDAKYKFAENPWIALRVQTTDRLACSQVPSKDKLLVSGIALAS